MHGGKLWILSFQLVSNQYSVNNDGDEEEDDEDDEDDADTTFYATLGNIIMHFYF